MVGIKEIIYLEMARFSYQTSWQSYEIYGEVKVNLGHFFPQFCVIKSKLGLFTYKSSYLQVWSVPWCIADRGGGSRILPDGHQSGGGPRGDTQLSCHLAKWARPIRDVSHRDSGLQVRPRGDTQLSHHLAKWAGSIRDVSHRDSGLQVRPRGDTQLSRHLAKWGGPHRDVSHRDSGLQVRPRGDTQLSRHLAKWAGSIRDVSHRDSGLQVRPRGDTQLLATWPNEQDPSETFLIATLDYR